MERRPCGFERNNDRTCVVFDAPMQPWFNQTITGVTRAQAGAGRLVFDAEDGLLVGRSTSQVINQPRTSYRLDITYRLARIGYGGVPKSDVFSLPRAVREVKKFGWDAKRMKEQLANGPS